MFGDLELIDPWPGSITFEPDGGLYIVSANPGLSTASRSDQYQYPMGSKKSESRLGV